MSELKHMRVGFGEGLVQAARLDARVVGLCADLRESVKMDGFAEEFPGRYVEAGVAEQNLIGLAAGLALSGKVAFAASYAAFSPGRTFDQIRVSVAYSNANVKVIGSHGGLSVGPDGATHQMLEDIAMMRALPNMTVVVPADYAEAKKATLALAAYEGPAYLRLCREATEALPDMPFALGKANRMTTGSDVTVCATGIMVAEALRAVAALRARGIKAEVLNIHTVKPLDGDAILASVRKTGCIVTAEEAQAAGGLGGAVAELLGERLPVPLQRVAVRDAFGESGTASELLAAYGLRSDDILKAALSVIARKR